MAEAKRRGYGEDGIYFDHRDDRRDSVHHRTCSGVQDVRTALRKMAARHPDTAEGA